MYLLLPEEIRTIALGQVLETYDIILGRIQIYWGLWLEWHCDSFLKSTLFEFGGKIW